MPDSSAILSMHEKAPGMGNEFALLSRTGVRTSFMALTFAWRQQGSCSRHGL